MSYYKCKYISMNRGKNEIRVTIADSSLRPLSFTTVDLSDKEKDFDYNCRKLFEQIYSRNIQCYPSIKNGTFEVADRTWKQMLKKNYNLSQNDLWNLSYEAAHETDPIKRSSLMEKVEKIKTECYKAWKEILNL